MQKVFVTIAALGILGAAHFVLAAGSTTLLTTGQVGFWSDSGTLAGDDHLFWNNTQKNLWIGAARNVAGSKVSVDATNFSNGMFVNGAHYGIASYGIDNGIQGQGTSPDSTGVYGRGGAMGVFGGNNSATGYGVYAQQLNQAGFGVYSLGGKNYFNGKVGIGTENPTATLTVNGGVEIGSASRPTGITLYDKVTAKAYCISISKGKPDLTAGACN